MHKALIFYGGFRARSGGAFLHALTSEKELINRGWSVRIVTLDDLPLPIRYLPHLLQLLINAGLSPIGFYFKGRLTSFLYRILFFEAVDLYIFEDIYLSRRVAGPSITILHAVWSDNLQAFNLSQARLELLVRRESALISAISGPVVTVSEPYRNYLVDIHFKIAPLRKSLGVIELGLDLPYRIMLKPIARRSIVYCGSLEARKNINFMLEVFEHVSEVDLEATLTIIGDGPERAKLERYALARGLRVVFKGRLSRAEAMLELANHSIYLHTSLKESFSYSLLEAKLCGLKTFALGSLQVPAEFIDIKLVTFDAKVWAGKILKEGASVHHTVDLSRFSTNKMVSRTLALALLERCHS